MSLPRLLSLAAALSLISTATPAQTIMQRNVSSAMAKAIIDGAMEECRKHGYKVVVVVVDRSGDMIGMLSDDGVNPHNFELARRKAYTARTFRQTSEQFFKRTETQPSTGLRNLNDVIWTGGGGAPIKFRDETIGGVGVSGAPGGKPDDGCAAAGIARVAEHLK